MNIILAAVLRYMVFFFLKQKTELLNNSNNGKELM